MLQNCCTLFQMYYVSQLEIVGHKFISLWWKWNNCFIINSITTLKEQNEIYKKKNWEGCFEGTGWLLTSLSLPMHPTPCILFQFTSALSCSQNCTARKNLTDDAIAWLSVTKFSTIISLYLTKHYVTQSFAIAFSFTYSEIRQKVSSSVAIKQWSPDMAHSGPALGIEEVGAKNLRDDL